MAVTVKTTSYRRKYRKAMCNRTGVINDRNFERGSKSFKITGIPIESSYTTSELTSYLAPLPRYRGVLVTFSLLTGVPPFNALVWGQTHKYRQKLESLGYFLSQTVWV